MGSVPIGASPALGFSSTISSAKLRIRLRIVLGFKSVKDADGNVIREPALGETFASGLGHSDGGDHQEDGFEDRDQIAGAIKASAGNVSDFRDRGARGA
jgi:hypothetical protein